MTTVLERAPVAVARLSRARSRRTWPVDRLLGNALAMLGGLLLWVGIGHAPPIGGDEGIYTEQTWSTLHGALTPYTYTYDHPFFGWVQIAPLFWVFDGLHVVGHEAVLNGRAVMAVYGAATLSLTYFVARRFGLSRTSGVAVVALLLSSSLFLDQARQVLLDNIATPWLMLALFLLTAPRQRQWVWAGAAVALAVAVLSKETTVLLIPAFGYLAWRRAHRGIRLMSLVVFGTVGALILAVYPLFAILRSEFVPGSGHVSLLSNGIAYQLKNRAGSGAIWVAGTDRHNLFVGWLSADSLLIWGGLGCAVVCLAVRRLRFIGLALALWAVPVARPSGYLPHMYVAVALPLLALAIGGVLDLVGRAVVSRLTRWQALTAAVAVIGVLLAVPAPVAWAQQRQRDAAEASTRGHAVQPGQEALAYVLASAPRSDVVVTDDAFWVDLQQAGFRGPWHAVSYYKFDLDPAASHAHLPEGWQNVSYVLSTHEMRSNTAGATGKALYPNTAAVVAHSAVVARFGSGDDEVDVLRVETTSFNDGGFR